MLTEPLLAEDGTDTTPLPPGLSTFQPPRREKKHTMQDFWPRLNHRGLRALRRGIQEVSVSVYSWMCCSAGDSNPASVIKAEGMSSLWTLPNRNPLAWRGGGMGEERSGRWRVEGTVYRNRCLASGRAVWTDMAFFPSAGLLQWLISICSHCCCLFSLRHDFNLNNVYDSVFQRRGNNNVTHVHESSCFCALVIIKERVQEILSKL